ncbi:MAG: CcoQ/FixQ family Cbb3-type cytochrome c oxidase assembly chaperone [Gammaproteobacteria bacterium]|nr:CcoQ/FixQ family Cbb3-type cytochrome c oxidase assembly chaperone [Gammaproteobacteria bacterium]
MDMTDFRSFYTVALLIIFVGIWAWAWSRSNKSRFNNAANSLFDEKEEQVHAASLEKKAGESNHGVENKS